MISVYLARQINDPKIVVGIKETLKTEKSVLIQREALILKCLNHPNIIKFINFYESPNYTHLIMEIASGGELFGFISKIYFYFVARLFFSNFY